MAGVRRVPFELAKLNEGLRKGETTFIVEGPRKCGPLHEWELTATCNMGGSGAAAIWREHAKEFFLPVYNSPVVILPDNDAPCAKSAAIIADALASVGVTVSLLELPVGPKGDIINWIDGGGTRQQFLDLVETEARAWEPGERIEVNLEAFAKVGAQCKEQRAHWHGEFISNAASIASHFDCLVCAVHHCPLSDDRRPRGWSGLGCNVEALLLLERTEGKLLSIMEVMKLKEEESHQKFTVHFSRVTIGKDEDGEDVTTLFVSSVDQGAAETAKQDKRKASNRCVNLHREAP
jgi:hypothetical protein